MTLAIERFGFLIPGSFAEDDPRAGIEETLELFALAERLGYDAGFVRHRHLERGIGSAAAFLAAATQRTRRIEIGTAVIQIAYESPFRLAEDLALVDVMSGGRLNIGLSAGRPQHFELLGPLVFDGDLERIDVSYERILKLRQLLRSEPLGPPGTTIPTPGGGALPTVPRLQPVAPGLVDRLWYGGGSLRSAHWAGTNGFNLLIGNVTSGEGTDNFIQAQLQQLNAYRAAQAHAAGNGRVAVGRVIVPTDSANAATRAKYAAYAEGRRARTLQAHGDRRTLFAPDIVGPAVEILNRLRIDPVLQLASELRLELPYEFQRDEYEQILGDFIRLVAPALEGSARPRASA